MTEATSPPLQEVDLEPWLASAEAADQMVAVLLYNADTREAVYVARAHVGHSEIWRKGLRLPIRLTRRKESYATAFDQDSNPRAGQASAQPAEAVWRSPVPGHGAAGIPPATRASMAADAEAHRPFGIHGPGEYMVALPPMAAAEEGG